MSQVPSIILSPGITGTAERTQINQMIDALNTMQSGPTRPATVEPFTMWINTAGAPTNCLLCIFDGVSTDIVIGSINISNDTFTPTGQLATFASGNTNKTGGFSLDVTLYGNLITCDATSAAIAVSLASGSALGSSWYAILKKTDATTNAVTITPSAGQTINGLNSVNLPIQGEGIILIKTSNISFITLDVGNNTVKQSSSDTTPGYLNQKITAGNGLSTAVINPGGNEQLSFTFNLDTNPGIEFNATKVRVKVDGTTITRTASGLSVIVGTAANDIVQLTAAGKLPAVDGSLLTGLTPPTATTSTLGICRPDNTTITVSGGVLSAGLPGAFAVGSYIMASYQAAGGSSRGLSAGATVAGSQINSGSATSTNGNGITHNGFSSGFSPSGTWMSMQGSSSGSSSSDSNADVSLFLRIV